MKSPLPERFEVLSYDQRGLGQSDKPDVACSMRDYAEDAVAILAELGWGQVCIAGYSFGGMVAQEIAIRWPERVSRLALAATTAGGAGGASYPIHELGELPPDEQARKRLEISDLSFSAQWQEANPEEANARIARRVAAQTRYQDEPGAETGKRRLLAARANHNTYDRLGRIAAPTLVLAGSRDGQAPLAAQRAMAARIPQCRFQVIDGSHQMLWDTDEAFLRIADFLEHT